MTHRRRRRGQVAELLFIGSFLFVRLRGKLGEALFQFGYGALYGRQSLRAILFEDDAVRRVVNETLPLLGLLGQGFLDPLSLHPVGITGLFPHLLAQRLQDAAWVSQEGLDVRLDGLLNGGSLGEFGGAAVFRSKWLSSAKSESYLRKCASSSRSSASAGLISGGVQTPLYALPIVSRFRTAAESGQTRHSATSPPLITAVQIAGPCSSSSEGGWPSAPARAAAPSSDSVPCEHPINTTCPSRTQTSSTRMR